MCSCYSGGHYAENIHTNTTSCNIEERQQKYRFGPVRFLVGAGRGGVNMFYWIQTLAIC